ncbi:hypothetical protein Droror1_Dr00019949 [Drosera rotundifolia]
MQSLKRPNNILKRVFGVRKEVYWGCSEMGSSVQELVKSDGLGGGVKDVYGEDFATEDQSITPWTVSVASGYSLLRDLRHNKGLAFSDKERETHYLSGLLPPAIATQELQERKLMNNLRSYEVPLQRYIAMMDLQVCMLLLYM